MTVTGTPAEGDPAPAGGGSPAPAGGGGPATVIVWVTEGTWHASVDAARALAPAGARLVLLHVTPEDVAGAAHGAFASLLGRGHPERDPGRSLERIAAASAAELLAAAAGRLGVPCTTAERRGRVEREVVAAAEGADLLIVARDGDRSRLGPKSLGKETRFVVDHAPCPVLLVWPQAPPGVGTIPPPPGHGPGHGPGPGAGHGPGHRPGHVPGHGAGHGPARAPHRPRLPGLP
jgi:nucleotide-binding universal stress UspA family protein